MEHYPQLFLLQIIKFTDAKVYATWKVDNVAVSALAGTTAATFANDVATITPTAYTVSSATANKTVALYVYAVKDNQVVWSYTSDAITVNPKNTADVVKATAADVSIMVKSSRQRLH